MLIPRGISIVEAVCFVEGRKLWIICLFTVPLHKDLWNYFRNEIQCSFDIPSSSRTLLCNWHIKNLNTRHKKLWAMIPAMIFWLERNARVFSDKMMELQEVISKAKYWFFCWVLCFV